MQHRHRNNRYDRRSPPRSGYRNFGRRDGNGFGRQPYRRRNPPPRDPAKEEVFKKAGKLAANYLVSKGLLLPSALKRKRERTGKRADGDDGVVRRWDSREYHRRRFDDGGDDFEERRRRQTRRVDGGDEGGKEADRERGEVRWTGRRPWGCYDDRENEVVEREGYYRKKKFSEGPRSWRGRSRDGADEDYRWRAGSSRGRREVHKEEGLDLGLKKTGDRDDDTSSYESGEVRDDDHLYWYGENEGERKNGDELSEHGGGGGLLELSRAEEVRMDGGGGGLLELSRAEEVRMDGGGGSSSNSREEPSAGFTIDLNKPASEGSFESDGDGEMGITDKLLEKSQGSLDMDISDNVDVKSVMFDELDGAESRGMSKDDGYDILKLCSFVDVPTKPRTALAGRGIKKINELFLNEVNVVGEIAAEVPKANVEGLVVEGLSTDLRMDQANTSRGEESGVLSIIFDKHVEESVNEVIESSELLVNVNVENQAVEDPLEEPEIKRVSVVEELVTGHVGGQEKPVRDDSSPEFKPEDNIKMEAEEQPRPTFFKVCDLNLMAPPEENEAEDDLVSDHLNACMPVSGASRDLPVGFGRSMGIVPNKTNVQCLFSRGKTIPVIDLEDDSSTESIDHDSPNYENGAWYSNVAHLTENRDRHRADKGCSSANPEFHQADILGYPLPPSEPQAGMGFSVQRFREGRGSSDSAA